MFFLRTPPHCRRRGGGSSSPRKIFELTSSPNRDLGRFSGADIHDLAPKIQTKFVSYFLFSRSDLDGATERTLTIASRYEIRQLSFVALSPKCIFQRSFSLSLATILNKNLQAKNSTNAHLIDRLVENCQSRRKSPFNPLFWGPFFFFQVPYVRLQGEEDQGLLRRTQGKEEHPGGWGGISGVFSAKLTSLPENCTFLFSKSR